MKFRLKAGSASEGGKTYNWKDPARNIVESDRNLAAEMPEKFERIEDHLYDVERYTSQRPAGAPQPNALPNTVPSAAMPKLDATTSKQINREGKTVDDRYGDLSSMTVNDLKEIAEAEEVPLPKPANAKTGLTKEEIVKALRTAK